MRELSEIFIQAKKKRVYKDMTEFEDLLKKIIESDSNLQLDWDDGAGEEWAMIIKTQVGIVCMLNIRIGIGFIRKMELSSETLIVLNSLFLVDVLDYTSEIWCMNLEKQIPEISCEGCTDVIDVTKMSLHDLYFVSV